MPYFQIEKLVRNDKSGDWCLLPYPGHPKGCPNYGKKKTCPPVVPLIDNFIDVDGPIYLVYSEFDLASHAKRMKAIHPEWTDRQCRCVLYWQGTSKKLLKFEIKKAVIETGLDLFVDKPEAVGVNVYATCALSGLKLEKIRDLKVCRHVAIIGQRP